MGSIKALAPSGNAVDKYDRQHLALYAALIDAADANDDWRKVAASLMHLDVERDGAEACWRSHLDRARWIVGEGMAAAISAFGGREAT